MRIRKEKQQEQLAKRRSGAGGGGGGGAAAEGGDALLDAPFGGFGGGAGGAAGGFAAAGAGAAGARAPTVDMLPQLTHALMHGSEAEQLEATIQFRRLLSVEKLPPIDQVIGFGAVPLFVRLLAHDPSPRLQFEAAWALTNIASGTTEHTQTVIAAGAVPHFVRLLDSESEDVREQAVWALGNIAGDGTVARDLVLDAGALAPLLRRLVPDAKLGFIRNATWTLSNFCRGKPFPDFAKVRDALPTLAALIYAQDKDVLTDALWALSYLSDGDHERLAAVLEARVVKRVVELLSHAQLVVRTPALRTVGNIVTGDDLQTQAVIQAGALPYLLKLLQSDKKAMRKEACWTVSNIMAGSQEQIQAVLDANAVPVLIHLLQHGEWEVKKEACWALSNATSGGSPAQISYLVSQGVVYPIAEMLKVEDPRIAMVALEGLENILKSGKLSAEEAGGPGAPNAHLHVCREAGVHDALLELNHAPSNIYNKALALHDAYFAGDEEDEGADDAVDDDGDDGGAGEYDAGGNQNAVAIADEGFGGGMAGGGVAPAWQVPGPAAFAFAPAPAPGAAPAAPAGAAWGGGAFNFGAAQPPPAPGGGGGGAFQGGFSFS